MNAHNVSLSHSPSPSDNGIEISPCRQKSSDIVLTRGRNNYENNKSAKNTRSPHKSQPFRLTGLKREGMHSPMYGIWRIMIAPRPCPLKRPYSLGEEAFQ